MDWTDPRHPLWPRLLAGCAVLTALPLWLHRYLPFTDLPQHVATIATLRHWGDVTWSWPYELSLGSTQQLPYYIVGALLAFPLGDAERANLVLLTLIALALPYAFRSLLRAMNADARLALFAPAMFWSEPLVIGFLPYLAALPVLFWALAAALRDAVAPTRRGAALLAGLSALLFTMHVSAFLLFAPCAVLAFAALPKGTPLCQRMLSFPRRMAWTLPTIFVASVWLLTSRVVRHGDVGGPEHMTPSWQSPLASARELHSVLMDVWQGRQDDVALVMLLGFMLLAAIPARGRSPAAPDDARRRLAVMSWVLVSALLYFAMPVGYGWLWALNHRYAITTLMLLPAIVRVAPGRRGAIALLGGAATAIFSAELAESKIRAFQTEVVGFDAVLARAEPGKRLIALVWAPTSSVVSFAPFLHFGSYYRARKGGIAEFSFTELPHSPLRYKPGVVPEQRPLHWEWSPELFEPEEDGAFYDYVLVRGGPERPFEPESTAFVLVAHEGSWRLFTRR